MWQIDIRDWASRDGHNEDGELNVVVTWGVIAYNEDGQRFGYCGPVCTRHRQDAQGLADRIRRHQADHPGWTPVDNRHWNESDPVYGSPAYQRGGYEEAWAQRERQEDAWGFHD